jgi:hypothetical protein
MSHFYGPGGIVHGADQFVDPLGRKLFIVEGVDLANCFLVGAASGGVSTVQA